MALLLGLDQGTSGTKAYLLSADGRRVGLGYVALPRHHPRPDWTEQDPQEVAAGARDAIDRALHNAGARASDLLAVGIASQRDTDFIWDARSGQPLANAITWQDLRTMPLVAELDRWELASERRHRLGYFPGPWCAAMHLAWRVQNQPQVRAALAEGHARVGMSGGWLLAALGAPSGHLHDYSLVQKTGLWDFRSGRYWPEWLERLDLTTSGLPAPAPTLHNFGSLRIGGSQVPVTAMVGDQQGALFGHGCRKPGQAECTHGTVSFVNVVADSMANRSGGGADPALLGSPPVLDSLNVYHAWSFAAVPPEARLDEDRRWAPGPAWQPQHVYCLEADTTTTGAAVRWMVNQGGMLPDEGALDRLATSVPDSGGVVFVPAFTGLNVPYNDHSARGAIVGMSLGVDRGHIVRALLEAVGYQVRAILETIRDHTGLQVAQLHVGGGLSGSDIACQIQADLLGIPVLRPLERETTARGAALLAGLGAGVWRSQEELPPLPAGSSLFEPTWRAARRDEGYARWQKAVAFVQDLASSDR